MFYDNLKLACKQHNLKVTSTVIECGGAAGSIDGWKKGAMPNSKIVVALAMRLNVSTDYLLLGKENAAAEAVSIGQQSPTITNSSNVEVNGIKHENAAAPGMQPDETADEILRILRELPLRERSKLLTMIYDFEDDYKKTFERRYPEND